MRECFFFYIRNISGKFFYVMFKFFSIYFFFINVGGSENIIFSDAFIYYDGVFKVIVILRYECYAYIFF